MARAHLTAAHAPSRTPLKLIAAASLAAALAVGVGAPVRAGGDATDASQAVAVAARGTAPDGARTINGARTRPDAEANGISWGKKLKGKSPPKRRGRRG